MEAKHMKSYFRSLKRSKSKGIVDQEQTEHTEPKNFKTENNKNLNKTLENNENKMKNHQKKEQLPLEKVYKRLNDKHNDAKLKNAHIKVDDTNKIEDSREKETVALSVEGFTDVSFWREPLPSVDIQNLPNDGTKLKTVHIEVDDNNKIEDTQEEEEAVSSVDDFTDVCFWKEPFPHVDIHDMAENSNTTKNAAIINLEENRKVFPCNDQSEGQYNAAAFWKDPIPEVDLSKLIENNIMKLNVDEDNVTKAIIQIKANEDIKGKSNNAQMTTELVKMNDELSDNVEMLERENKSLSDCLEGVKDDIMKLETRIRTLELSRKMAHCPKNEINKIVTRY